MIKDFDQKLDQWLLSSDALGIKRPEKEEEFEALLELADQLIPRLSEPKVAVLFDLLSDYIGDWEREHEEPIPDAAPHEMLSYYMDIKGLKQTDLLHIIDQGNLSKILSGKRKIGARLAKRFGEYFGVNPGVFL